MTKKRKKPRKMRPSEQQCKLMSQFGIAGVRLVDIKLLLDKKMKEEHKSFILRYWSTSRGDQGTVSCDDGWFLNTDIMLGTLFGFGDEINPNLRPHHQEEILELFSTIPNRHEIVIFEIKGGNTRTHTIKRDVEDNY